jgi:3-oxoacyl-[acyl-carrier protein] reductase
LDAVDNKVVLVSGGSKGLGRAIARDLLDHGYIVATFSRSKTEFITQAITKNKDNDTFYWESIDAHDFKALKNYVYTLYKKYGKIDALINNAGINFDGLLPVTPETEIHHLLAVNLEATILLTRLVSGIMLQRSTGVIINISSITGIRGFKGTSVYGATKAALDGFTRSLARELGGRGIRVNSVAPGFLETDMTKDMSTAQKSQIIRRTPLNRLGRVEDISGVIRFLLSDDAVFITGQTMVVDGGLTC